MRTWWASPAGPTTRRGSRSMAWNTERATCARRRRAAGSASPGPGAPRSRRPARSPENSTSRARAALDEPAATIMSSRLGNPRWEAGDPQDQRNYERQNVALRQVTIAEAAALQSFPHDYPFQGSRTAQFRQVGDAVPPQLAMHVLRAAAGLS